ncbi:MAG: hypothetical protein GF403_06240 [Candidatus Coatesbacteria bacterium]|nr:hypothetical protein [Candidatus Coatesbacteria bacterium]
MAEGAGPPGDAIGAVDEDLVVGAPAVPAAIVEEFDALDLAGAVIGFYDPGFALGALDAVAVLIDLQALRRDGRAEYGQGCQSATENPRDLSPVCSLRRTAVNVWKGRYQVWHQTRSRASQLQLDKPIHLEKLPIRGDAE